VALNDGVVPFAVIPIEMVCHGEPRVVGYADMRGSFSLSLARDPGGPQPGGFRSSLRDSAELSDCELRASLAGFRSDAIPLFGYRQMDSGDVGTIILHRVADVEGLTISATSALAPKSAREAYEKGLQDVRRKKLEPARKAFEKAVAVYPRFAFAWFEIGKLDELDNQAEAARGAYKQALAADDKFIGPYERLYALAFKEDNWPEVAALTSRVIGLNPYDFPAAYFFNAVANLNLNQLDAAEKGAREAVKLDTGQHNPTANYVLGIVLARKRDFTESADRLRAFLIAAPNAPATESARRLLSTVERLAAGNKQLQPATPGVTNTLPALGFH
jgi:tetratricopeptide (TPR) repeat protein